MILINIFIVKIFFETLNMATVSKLIIKACLKREESLGCHYIEK